MVWSIMLEHFIKHKPLFSEEWQFVCSKYLCSLNNNFEIHRSRNDTYRCVGVDPNRNWGYHWNEGGTSDNPCSDIYMGPEAWSEVEIRYNSPFPHCIPVYKYLLHTTKNEKLHIKY